MIDQASELRDCMRAEREALERRRAVPNVISLFGAAPQVGVSTIADRITQVIQQQDLVTHMLPMNSPTNFDMRRFAASDFVILDCGADPTRSISELWRQSGLVLLVMSPDEASVLGAYRAIKQWHHDAPDTELGSLINMNRLAQMALAAHAETAHERLRNSAQRFLGVEVKAMGSIPHEITLEQCAMLAAESTGVIPPSIESLAHDLITRMNARKQLGSVTQPAEQESNIAQTAPTRSDPLPIH